MNDNPTNAGAQYHLGRKYEFGRDGVPKDTEKMLYWYTKAAEQGHAEAQYELGLLYGTGGGTDHRIPIDMAKRTYWYKKAAEQGHAEAQKLLKKSFCYVATCVYGSYDCPEVWTLRRYRDTKLSKSWFGRRFIQVYYAVSPKVVEVFGNKKWFNRLFKPILNKLVRKLQNSGVDI